MNKQDNKLAVSVLSTLIAGIALIYTLIMYHKIIFAVAGMSVIFLITAYILTQNIIAFMNRRNTSLNMQLRKCIDDISTQIEIANSSQSQIGKATYLYTKQAAKAVSSLENNYTESQETLYRNLVSLSHTQNKATKLMIKYDHNNTMKLIATIRELRNQISETMVQGFDQLQPDNGEVVAALHTIVDYLKSQSNQMDQSMSIQLNNVARELQNISNSIQQVQIPVSNMMPVTPVASSSYTAPVTSSAETTPVSENVVTPETVEEIAVDNIVAPDTEETVTVPQETPVEEAVAVAGEAVATDVEIPTEEIVATDIEIPAEETVATDIEIPAEEIVSADIEIPTEETVSADIEIPTEETVSADVEIPAEETVATDIEIPAEEAVSEEEPFTPTFTVVGKSDAPAAKAAPEPTPEPAPEPVSVAPVSDDPNKQLSADEIAALFAAAEPAPKKEPAPEPTPEPVSVTPVSDDPNKQLSADEIAALFAQMN
jgi:hypothetical protein